MVVYAEDLRIWNTPSYCKKKQSRSEKEEKIRANNRFVDSKSVEFTLNNGHPVMVLVNLEFRNKMVCFFYCIDEHGEVILILLVSAKHGDIAGLCGSFEWRTNTFAGCTQDELLNATWVTLIKEAKEEINVVFTMDYLRKHCRLIAADPWFGKGKPRTDGLGPRENKYIPYTGVLNITEWLLSNFKGATVSECVKEFVALSSTQNPYVSTRDGEIMGIEAYPIRSVPMKRVWAPHRYIMTKNMHPMDDSPTFKEVLGECVNVNVIVNVADHNYDPSVFVENVRSLKSKDEQVAYKSLQFFIKLYPTLSYGASNASDVYERILALKTKMYGTM